MTYEVGWHTRVTHKAADLFGPERSTVGSPSEYDFVCGPLAAAVARFRAFDTLPEEAGPSIRSVHVVDPAFGALVFVGVLVGQAKVEIADFDVDPGYWELVESDPED